MRSAGLYWREIMTYIKGSASAYGGENRCISKAKYLEERAKSALSESQLEQVWEVFEEYNEWTTRRSLFDEIEFVNFILLRMD